MPFLSGLGFILRNKAMCGRFVLFSLADDFKIDESLVDIDPNYNVAPSQEIPVIIRDNGKNILDKFHWGLVPFWAKDKKMGNRLINARMETIAEKPAFRATFKKRRCLIPANGFYEWKKEDGNKQPYFITPKPDKPFAFAGLWEIWEKEEQPYKSALIITTEASESIQPLHNRMPVILKKEFHEKWLDVNIDDPLKVIEEGIVTDFQYHPVSKRVNTVEHNVADCIERV